LQVVFEPIAPGVLLPHFRTVTDTPTPRLPNG
jgi:hypothetical protein